MRPTVFRAAIGVAVFGAGLAVWAQQQEDPEGGAAPAIATPRLSRTDQQFVFKAVNGGLVDVELGKLAQLNGEAQEVKDFGRMLIAAQQKANQDLERVALQFGIILPTKMNPDHQRSYEKLRAKTGRDFDTAFINHTVKHHEKLIKLFQNQSMYGETDPLREFATQAIPVLQEHLKTAQGLKRAKISSL